MHQLSMDQHEGLYQFHMNLRIKLKNRKTDGYFRNRVQTQEKKGEQITK